MYRWTQLDRGTDFAAIWMRRSTVLVPALLTLAWWPESAVAGWLIGLTALAWLVFTFVWLMLRPRRSPLVFDRRAARARLHHPGAKRAASARRRPRASRRGS